MLGELVRRCATLEKSFGQLESDADGLTPYAVEVRYESAREVLDAEARDARQAAMRAVGFVAARLSNEIDALISAEEEVEKAREEQQVSALRAELAELKGEASGDKESK